MRTISLRSSQLKIHDVSNFGWGMLMMGYLNCRGERERALVVRMVEELGRKMGEGGEVMESQDLRRCVWVLTSIRSHLNSSIREKELEKEMEKEKVEKMDKIAKDVENDISISGNSTNHDSDNNNNNNNNNNDNNSGSDNDHNHNLLRATDKQLQKLANIVEVEAEKDTLSCADLRFVLQSFVASTTRADEMVKAIEKCASRRLEIFGLGGGQKQKQKQIVGGLIEEVATLSVKSVESLGGERALLYSELKEGKEDFAKKVSERSERDLRKTRAMPHPLLNFPTQFFWLAWLARASLKIRLASLGAGAKNKGHRMLRPVSYDHERGCNESQSSLQ